MPSRYAFCERLLRQVYGEQPTDDSNVTVNLVNQWLNDGIGIAARQNYKESAQMDGIAYVNNSFYTTFSGIVPVAYQGTKYQITLPQIPVGIGQNEGVKSLKFIDSGNNISLDCIPLTANQTTFSDLMQPIYNKILYYSEGIFLYAISVLPLDSFTASVSMVSGGDSSDLNSILNVPDDYINIIVQYVTKMLQMERAAPKDQSNDGQDS